MTITKQSSLASKDFFDEHIESTKSELRKINSKDDLSDKQKKVLTELLRDDLKIKQETEEFKSHKEVRKADYEKIRAFVVERVGDAKKVTKEDMQDAIDLFYTKKEKKSEKKEFSETQIETLEKKLLNKEHMDQIDKENMQISLDCYKRNNIYTVESLQKLDENVSYTPTTRIIGPVEFERNKVVPQVKFKSETNQYDVFESNNKGVFKTKYNGKDEYYLSTDAYIAEGKKQGKTCVENDHLRNALQALPGEYKDNEWCVGKNILGNILNMSMSGFVDADGRWLIKVYYGFLGSASPVGTDDTRAFRFSKGKGNLDTHYDRYSARPCLFVVK